MTKKQAAILAFRILGVYLTVHNAVALLNIAVTTRNILKNRDGSAAYILGLGSYAIMLLLGVILLLAVWHRKKKTDGTDENQLFESICTGWLIMLGSFSSILHLAFQCARSYMSIRSLLVENAELHTVIFHTFYIAGIEAVFFALEFLIGVGIWLGWFQRLAFLIENFRKRIYRQ